MDSLNNLEMSKNSWTLLNIKIDFKIKIYPYGITNSLYQPELMLLLFLISILTKVTWINGSQFMLCGSWGAVRRRAIDKMGP